MTTYLYNGNCLTNCPDGYYKSTNNQTCAECSTPLHCATCQNSSSCLTCAVPYYNYQSYCLVSCPTSITVQNSNTYNCDACPTNCTYCSGYPLTICTTCNTGYLLDQNRCGLTCVTHGYVPSGLICTQCNPICLTCNNTPTNCTSCDTAGTNPYLFNNNCLSACSGRYYSDSTTFTC